jgi:hypothetical protein
MVRKDFSSEHKKTDPTIEPQVPIVGLPNVAGERPEEQKAQ